MNREKTRTPATRNHIFKTVEMLMPSQNLPHVMRAKFDCAGTMPGYLFNLPMNSCLQTMEEPKGELDLTVVSFGR